MGGAQHDRPGGLVSGEGGLHKPRALEIPDDAPFANDRLNREPLARNLTNLVRSFDQPYVLAVDAPWGGGKTTFLRMWEALLKRENQATFYFNAWDSDYSDDPLLSFMSTMDEVLQVPKGVRDAKKKPVSIGASIGRHALPQIVEVATAGIVKAKLLKELADGVGLSPEAVGEIAQSVARERLSAHKEQKASLGAFRRQLIELSEHLAGSEGVNTPLVIFVDELDRCRPLFAVELLEGIKHLFNVRGVVFVLGMVVTQLGHAVKTLYGDDLDAGGYFRRFIDAVFDLPVPAMDEFFVGLLEADGALVTRDWTAGKVAAAFSSLAVGLGLSYRDAQQAFARCSFLVRIAPQFVKHTLIPALIPLSILAVNHRGMVKGFFSGERGSETWKSR